MIQPFALRSFTLVLLIACASWLMAQPHPFGCHHFRQGTALKPQPLTKAQKALIDETIARSDTFDILHYDIDIDVTDVVGQAIKAVTTITFTARMDGLGIIRFDLAGLQVDSVLLAGQSQPFVHANSLLRITLDPPMMQGEQRELSVFYRGTPLRDPQWGGFYFESGYIYNLGIGISTIPPNFGKVWYPCFDSFVERATYSYKVKSVMPYRAHGQGTFLGEVQLGGDTIVRSYELLRPIPTHISAIAVSDYQVHAYTHTGAHANIPVTLTGKAAHLPNMIARFGDLGAAIDVCEYWYGPYPFDRVGYVLTTDGALEIATNIAYPQFMVNQGIPSNRALFTHELGHHWWGDIVTPYIHNDMWLKEGPAEYSGHLIEEWIGGPEAFRNAVMDNQLYVLQSAHIQDGGFQPLSPMPDPHIYGSHTYYKGAAVLHNLRGYLGDSLFRVGMHEVQLQYGDTALDAGGFRDALEQVTGADLHPFFDAWVFAPGFSVFTPHTMSVQPNGGGWLVDVVLRQRLRGTAVFHEQVPLDLTLIGADRQRRDHRVMAGGEFSTITLTSDIEPVMVVVNGYNRLNQARMDHEMMVVPGQSFTSLLPRTEFRLYPEQIVDSTLVRVEHIWAAPDQDQLAQGVDAISSTHFWRVEGVWPAGTHFSGRLFYYGTNANQLDHDLFGVTEQGVQLLYRADPSQPWSVYNDRTITAGSLTNGTGYITIDTLRRGEYAFGKGDAVAGIHQLESGEGPPLRLMPNPASDHLILLDATGSIQRVGIMGPDGRSIGEWTTVDARAAEVVLDVSTLPPGHYMVQGWDERGLVIGTGRFVVSR